MKKVVTEGECCPRFYLPVKRECYGRRLICYHISIAWMALILVAFKNAFMCFWYDIVGTINEWKEAKEDSHD